MSLGMGFESSDAQAKLVAHTLFLLPADQDVELSAFSPAPCLCVTMLPTMVILD